MRKILDPTETFAYGVRSDYNGPAIIEEYKTSTILEDDPFYLYYKVAKPYERYTGSLTKPRFAEVLTDQGPTIFFSTPESYKILEATMDTAKREFPTSVHDLFSDKAYVINRALERSQAYGDLLMLVSASEAKQTVRMIRTIFVRLFRIVLDIYNKVKKLDVFGTLDVITNIWLEYRYGWTPLIGELGAIKDALTVIRPNGIKSAYATDKPTNLFRDFLKISDVYLSDTVTDCVFDAYIENIDQITRKAGFNYMNKPQSRNDSWAAIFGVDIDSLASTAWELIPFSFIIDMFFNFGSLLQTRDVADQVDSFNGWMTCRLNGELRLDFKEVRTKPVYINPSEYLFPQLSFIQYRAVLDNLPFARMAGKLSYDKVIAWNNSFSATRYSLDRSDQEIIVISNPVYSSVASPPKAGIADYQWKVTMGRQLISRDFKVPKDYFPDRPFDNQYLRDQVIGMYAGGSALRVEGADAVCAAYFDSEYIVIDPSEVQKNLNEALSLKLQGIKYSDIKDESHRLNGYAFAVNRHGERKPGSSSLQYATEIIAYKRRKTSLSVTNPELLKSFNQSIDIQLLDRTLMPEFNQALTADMDLSSAQYADLTAFAFKLGNYFRQLK